MRKPTLYSSRRECFICGSPYVELHHVYGGRGRRKVSDDEGCTVYLCHSHHQGKYGAHLDKGFDLWLKRDCQLRWMVREGATVDDFIRVFGRNYLEGSDE